jgi:hypothetical protein
VKAPDTGRFDEHDLATVTEHIRLAVANGATVGKYRLEARLSEREAETADQERAEYLRDYVALLSRACDEVEPPLPPASARAWPSDRVNAAALKARVDLVMFLERRGVRFVKVGRRFQALCPLHDDHSPSFSVDPELQRWKCFGACAVSGDVFDFVQLADRVSFTEAVAIVAREATCPV